MRRARVLAMVLAVLAGVPAAGGSDPLARAASAGAPAVAEKRAFILGDSVMLGAQPNITESLGAEGWQVAMYAFVGQFLNHAIERVREHRAEVGQVVVIQVGNNYYGDRAQFRAQIDEAMRELADLDRVFWLNVQEFDPSRHEVNEELAAAQGRWRNLVVVDWNAIARSVPGVNYSDGIHLTPTGRRLMSDVVRGLLTDWYATYPCRGPARPLVYPFGGAPSGNVPVDLRVRQPVAAMAPTPSGRGFWIGTADGGVFAFGDASFKGSAGNVPLTQPIVGMAATPTGRGYWLVARDGGVFAFGDAVFHGSTGAMVLNRPVVGMAATPTGRGYWLVASDGGVFAFGDAVFHGSTGAIVLNRPVVGVATTPRGDGYWLAASDGGVFAFGTAAFHRSAGALPLQQPVVGMARTPSAGGYWLVARDGGLFNYGDAAFMGSRGGARPDECFVAVAGRPQGDGYWLAAQRRL